MSVGAALSDLARSGLGPLGGNVNNPKQHHERRQAGLRVDGCRDGALPLLHKGDTFQDTATYGLKNEQPWHRMAAFMLLAGRTNSEIAAAAQVKPGHVSILRAQRWFQELLAILANETGEDITGLLAAEQAASVEKLVTLRDDPTVPSRVQMTAALALLEHARGKPTQRVVSLSASTTFSSEKEELEAIQAELANLRNKNSATSV